MVCVRDEHRRRQQIQMHTVPVMQTPTTINAARIPTTIQGVVWRPSAIIIRDRRLVNSVPQGNGTDCGVHA